MAGGFMDTEYLRTFTAFSGADMVVTFGNRVFGELQSITYSVTREKAPIYTAGSADPRAFARGKRGIAGSLVFVVFDRDALIEGLKDVLLAQGDSQGLMGLTPKMNVNQGTRWLSVDQWGLQFAPTGDLNTSDLSSLYSRLSIDNIEYADQIPPFNCTITFGNEYGQYSQLRIYGIEILNEGMGISIDDLTTNKMCTFVARGIDYMGKQQSTFGYGQLVGAGSVWTSGNTGTSGSAE